MKLKLIYIISSILIITGMACSEINEDIAEPVTVSVHKSGITSPSSANFHGKILQQQNWNLKECAVCHGANYGGGVTNSEKGNCLTCHTQSAGPEACNTCHGDFADPTRIAPPTDLAGNSGTSAKGVGAHTSHIYEMEISEPLGCFDCHANNSVQGEKYVYSHLGSLPADMALADGSYDANTFKCSNTYCHGNFSFSKAESTNKWAYTADQMTGGNFSPQWNKVDGTQAACGTCHGSIDASGTLISALPNGHTGTFKITDCVLCHPAVVDKAGKIIDPVKHINGMANLTN
ncbi:MAG: hypothetical protein KKB34_13040 [Bacteroidetes bacterium]|nr:hypothetical protein [Bacteroidota bacterium]